MNKKVFVFVGMFFVTVFVILLSILVYFKISQPKSRKDVGSVTLLSPTPKPISKALPLPKITVNNWVNEISSPPALTSQQALVYNYKQNYSLEEIKYFASHIIRVQKTDQNNMWIGIVDDNGNILQFNKNTGSFNFISVNGLDFMTGSNVNNGLIAFLQKMELYDGSLTLSAHYKKVNEMDITYYEFHRNWNKTGAPILNFVGLSSLADNEKINQLKLEGVYDKLPKDENIVSTSDNKDGLARHNFFNTITFAVDDATKKITSIDSSLRFYLNNPTKEGVISFNAAYQKLLTRSEDMFLTTPTGLGQVNLAVVYPQNTATMTQATITDSAFVYLEKSPGAVQLQLKPYFIFRGSGVLSSGYKVNFVAAIEANNNPEKSQSVLGASIQQGTIDFTKEFTPDCADDGWTNYCMNQKDCENVAKSDLLCGTNDGCKKSDRCQGANQFVCHCSVSVTQPPATSVTNPPQTVNPTAGVTQKPVPTEVPKSTCAGAGASISYNADGTDMYFSGGGWVENAQQSNQCQQKTIAPITPSLFVYTGKNDPVKISISAEITSADPKIQTGKWIFTQDKINQQPKSYLYYEYLPSEIFAIPESGWNVSKNEIGNFTQMITNKLNLNVKENERLVTEIAIGLSQVQNSDDYFFGLIPQQEVDRKLPIVADKQLTEYRFHFYITSSEKQLAIQPNLFPINRLEPYSVEIGVVPGK